MRRRKERFLEILSHICCGFIDRFSFFYNILKLKDKLYSLKELKIVILEDEEDTSRLLFKYLFPYFCEYKVTLILENSKF